MRDKELEDALDRVTALTEQVASLKNKLEAFQRIVTFEQWRYIISGAYIKDKVDND